MASCRRCCCGCLGCLAVAVVLLAVAVQRLVAASHVEEPPASMVAAPALPIPKLALPGGGSMPVLGLGLCCRLTAWGESVRKSVLWYLLLGGRHLDDAELYNNHGAVGEGIRQAISRGVPREEVFFTTKIPGHLFGTEATTTWFNKMLNETGLDYVDLVLLHSAGPEKVFKQDLACGSMPDMRRCREETWLELASLRSQGKVRHLGVSNFGARQIQELQALNSAPVAVNQLEYHPWVGEEHRKAVDHCHRHSIAVTAYTLFCRPSSDQDALKDPKLQAIAEAHGKSTAQVLLRWAFQGNLSAVPGTGNPKHMKSNMDIFDFELSVDEMNRIGQLWSDKQVSTSPQHVPDAIG